RTKFEKQKQRIARYRSKSEMQNLESLYKKRIADFCDNLIRKQDRSALQIRQHFFHLGFLYLYYGLF
ncbi:MAG: hypothetical protein LBT05_07845, partial [Planctomycetaceae bacterium]|nr:hypothetical protein [Planctomycetaceae bacterium]